MARERKKLEAEIRKQLEAEQKAAAARLEKERLEADAKSKADVAAKADLESPDDLAERDAAKNEDEGPAMASDDDVERLNRMFGGGSE